MGAVHEMLNSCDFDVYPDRSREINPSHPLDTPHVLEPLRIYSLVGTSRLSLRSSSRMGEALLLLPYIASLSCVSRL